MGHCKHSYSPRVEQLEDRSLMSANVVLDWNQVVLDAIKATGTNPLLGSRALAITQAAVYDAVNAIEGTHAAYAFCVTLTKLATAGLLALRKSALTMTVLPYGL